MKSICRLFTAIVITVPAASIYANPFFYVGSDGGSFIDEVNWNDAADGTGSAPAAGTIDTSVDITVDLIVDGADVLATDIDFGQGGSGSLTLINGADVTQPGTTADFDIDFDGAFTLDNSSLAAADFVFFDGVINLTGGTITAGDEVNFQDDAVVTINGTSITADDDIEFQGTSLIDITGGSFVATASGSSSFVAFQGFAAGSTITGATFTSGSLSIESAEESDGGVPADVVATDTTFIVAGNFADGAGSDAGTLTLLGSSSYTGDDLAEGADLLLGGASTATLGTGTDTDPYVGEDGSTVTLLTKDASLTLPFFSLGALDPRDFILDGITGLTYNEDPSRWNVSNWDGESAVTLQVVPEPSVLSMLALAGLTALKVRRRQQGGSC